MKEVAKLKNEKDILGRSLHANNTALALSQHSLGMSSNHSPYRFNASSTSTIFTNSEGSEATFAESDDQQQQQFEPAQFVVPEMVPNLVPFPNSMMMPFPNNIPRGAPSELSITTTETSETAAPIPVRPTSSTSWGRSWLANTPRVNVKKRLFGRKSNNNNNNSGRNDINNVINNNNNNNRRTIINNSNNYNNNNALDNYQRESTVALMTKTTNTRSFESGSSSVVGFGVGNDNNNNNNNNNSNPLKMKFEIESMPVEVSDLEKLTNALDTAF